MLSGLNKISKIASLLEVRVMLAGWLSEDERKE
jgi:hypothetical protein